jgi:nicotinate-nucleotide adenylyltransferase
MKKVGLYFGTFNPIHMGHLVIANHMVEFSQLDEVWFVVTPQSPFKAKKSLLDNNHRYQMVLEATEDYPKLRPSTIEFGLDQPNYTIDTLAHLSEKYPEGHQFGLIMGEDNLKSFHKWKNYEVILAHYELYVYPRISEGSWPESLQDHPHIHMVDAPIMEISSTFIRKSHKAGKNIRPLLPEAVWRYMDEMNFYR